MRFRRPTKLDTTRYFNRCLFVDQQGRTSESLIKLATIQPRLTFDKRFLDPAFVTTTETPFEEIRRAEPEKYYPGVIPDLSRPFEGSYEAYLQALLDAIKSHLLKIDTSKPCFFSHSSGTDSRIISGVMTDLRRTRQKTFENVVFHCWGRPEEKSFRAIMDRQEWRNISVLDDTVDNPYHLGSPSVSVDGWNSYSAQFRFWGKHTPKDYILLSGAEGETYMRAYPEWAHSRGFFMNRGEAIHRLASTFNGIIVPFLSHEVLKVTMAMPAEWRNIPDKRMNRDKVRTDLVELLGLADIPIETAPYNLNLTPKVQEEMLAAYERGRFYKDFGVSIDRNTLFTRLGSWDACVWGFAVTVYDRIMANRDWGPLGRMRDLLRA